MASHDVKPDPELTAEQRALVNCLNEKDIVEIDNALLESASNDWRKVARVVGGAMLELPERVPGIPDIYYAERVKELVNKGLLESQGNLQYMRYSEVRIPVKEQNET